ncbi:MAG: 23S rRNA (pseudouridine(1915)-N(3))-methyltransferase RlmH [Pseudomonadota bacterium]|nr:23S rRNA (pseudouridine(1915)-N(3))-methyltransferase RlmH [Pseudomonadota bacterium]
MKMRLLSVGTKMAHWVITGTEHYSKRIEREMSFSLVEIPLAKRVKNQPPAIGKAREAAVFLSKIKPDDYVVALDVKGRSLSTAQLADKLREFRMSGKDLALLIGGPDGLDDDCLGRANECWSLSKLTLPHPLVRVLVTEQLYRAISIINGHPYHRE